MDLFRISGFVEDKNLAKVKRLLSGLVYDLRDEPMIGTSLEKPKGQKPKVKATNPGGAAEVILAGMKTGQRITTKEAKAKLLAAGYPANTQMHFKTLSNFVALKVMRRVENGVYQLNKPKE